MLMERSCDEFIPFNTQNPTATKGKLYFKKSQQSRRTVRPMDFGQEGIGVSAIL
jgi:hypothetical protein